MTSRCCITHLSPCFSRMYPPEWLIVAPSGNDTPPWILRVFNAQLREQKRCFFPCGRVNTPPHCSHTTSRFSAFSLFAHSTLQARCVRTVRSYSAPQHSQGTCRRALQNAYQQSGVQYQLPLVAGRNITPQCLQARSSSVRALAIIVPIEYRSNGNIICLRYCCQTG